MSAGPADASSIFGAGMISTGALVVLKRNMPWNVKKELREGAPMAWHAVEALFGLYPSITRRHE
jgi:hypothetical protein